MVSLRVVTWNIRFGLEIDQAIRELGAISEIASADILLLQEMDEAGTAAIADAFDARYVYNTVARHAQTNRDFGNAVVSPWPVSRGERVLLPHQARVSGHPRHATRATVRVEERELLLYSVHTETPALQLSKRVEQFRAITTDIVAQRAGQTADPTAVIVGGDFNTVSPRAVRALGQTFADTGLVHASAEAGPTFRRAGKAVTLDHVFASGLRPTSSNVAWTATASDHKPMSVDFMDEAEEDA